MMVLIVLAKKKRKKKSFLSKEADIGSWQEGIKQSPLNMFEVHFGGSIYLFLKKSEDQLHCRIRSKEGKPVESLNFFEAEEKFEWLKEKKEDPLNEKKVNRNGKKYIENSRW